MKKTVKINKREVPAEDIIQIKMAVVSDEIFSEIKYRLFEPTYHEVIELVPRDKGYKIEKAVRRAMLRR